MVDKPMQARQNRKLGGEVWNCMKLALLEYGGKRGDKEKNEKNGDSSITTQREKKSSMPQGVEKRDFLRRKAQNS